VEVPGGTYYRTYTNSGTGLYGEADPATVSGFRLDKYDVTVGRFRQFLAAWNGGAGWTPPESSGKHAHLNGGEGLSNGWERGNGGPAYETGWVATDNANIAPTEANLAASCQPSITSAPGSNENLPMTCVNWYEAYAFCIWDGGFLPSEAEWEYAAVGGSQQRQYPWGATPPGTANQYAIYGGYYPDGPSDSDAPTPFSAPVGTANLGIGLWDQLDLNGNVFQWVIDWYSPVYGNPCTDCADLAMPEPSSRMSKGNYCCFTLDPPTDPGPATPPTDRSPSTGFRCARVP
jgi:formylglycine-generating enzyme required for sulfatase activity